jgi:peptidoglycan/LPS O-acetylase OafA/YrhL
MPCLRRLVNGVATVMAAGALAAVMGLSLITWKLVEKRAVYPA